MAISLHLLDSPSAQHSLPPRRYAWTAFAVVFALMVVDYIDRQVVVSMFPHLKAQWNLSDAELGGLASIVSLTVALGTVPLSLLSDRWSRVKSMFLMAIVWSCATIACAFAQSYTQLLGARSIVGLGEAAYGSVGAALLASLFPARMRSTILGTFLAAGLVGSVLGVLLGGVISHHWGWQAGFGAVGVPGLALALMFVLIVRDYKTVPLPGASSAANAPSFNAGAIVAALLKPRTALVACIGAGLQLVMVSSTWAWMPSYFNRYYSLSPDQAGFRTAVIVALGGIGAIVWSVVADRLSSRIAQARLYVPAITALMTAASMFVAFVVLPPGKAQLGFILAGAIMMTGSIGPVCAVVVDVVHPAVRATSASILSLTQNLFGLAAGPLLTGYLSDRYGLPFALSIVPVFCLLAAAIFAVAARTYEYDLKNAEHVAPAYSDPLQPAGHLT